jgi:uncharacterized protein (TIGR02300 family)
MPKEEWGVKRICPTTGRRFYDLNKKPIISPYTGETVELDANTRTRVAVAEKTEKKAAEAETPEDDILLEEVEVDEAEIGDDLLDDDDDDTVPLEEIADVAAPSDES